jgi:hypothetical protein
MAPPLRLVLCDTAVVDADTALSARALEACARAGVEAVLEPGLDADAVLAEWTATGPETIAVGASLSAAPVSAVWVGPLDLDVRGSNVRVAEDGDELLYEAVITELAERRARGR